jgi:ferritin-like metal-binding protein YciE
MNFDVIHLFIRGMIIVGVAYLQNLTFTKQAISMERTKRSTAKSSSKTASRRTAKPTAEQLEAANQSMLEEFFLDEIRDIYWAEKHLTKALPKMERAATSEELQTAFADHLEVTREQVSRLEQVFEMLGEKPRGKKCDGMEGLVKEAESVIEDTEAGTSTRDVGLIISAQKVEHYEIAAYGGLAQLAKTLGKEDVAAILGEILEEEKEADELLTNLAESGVNASATQEEEA